ncbi:hypothetical protein [Streptomyces sp. PTD5-9]
MSAAGDSARLGNRSIKPVAVVGAPEDTGVLELPVAGAGAGAGTGER